MPSRKRPDADNPEWTEADFAKAKSAKDVLSPSVLAKFGKHRGPQKAPTKVPISIRLSPAVVEYFKSKGPGWQARIDKTLNAVVIRDSKKRSNPGRKVG